MIPASLWCGEVRAASHEEADRMASRIVAQGRIVRRACDGEAIRELRLHLAIVEHPELPIGECYALYWMGAGSIRAYRTTPADAIEALSDYAAFNLA